MLIEFSDPIQINPGEYHYELTGLIKMKGITVRDSAAEAVEYIKELIRVRMERYEAEIRLPLRMLNRDTVKASEADEWTGINWNDQAKKFKVSTFYNAVCTLKGFYATFEGAVLAKREHNLELGFDEFYGFKGKLNEVK